jgi:hypothetical protein
LNEAHDLTEHAESARIRAKFCVAPQSVACSRLTLTMWATVALALAPALVWADSASDAHQVLAHRLAMPTPLTEFAKWQADQWTFASAECMGRPDPRDAVNPDLAKLNKLPVYLAGSRSLAKDNTCAEMAAKGPDAECFEFHSSQAPFTLGWPGMRSNYLYLKDAKLPDEGSAVESVAYCNLVKDSMGTRQLWLGKATLHWLSLPQLTQVQTASGSRSVKMGTVSFLVPGMPGAGRPITVLVP